MTTANSKTQEEIQAEALARASSGQSVANYATIFAGFAEKGIPEADIKPRENVLTFHAWRAKGRTVKKGEHGVRVLTFIDMSREDKDTGERKSTRRPWRSTVFHITQTEPL